ncbi:MAG: hypothetical protein ACJ8AW_33205 [Rhodopila sp.]
MGVFTSDWQAVGADRSWRDGTVVLDHNLPANPLFGLPALGKLIDTLPRENYVLMHTGPVGTRKRLWEEGDIGGLSGDAVIEAIRQGNLWLLIRHVDQVSKPMCDLMESIYAEINANVDGGYPTFNHISDILISSPSAQVYYHFDHNGQALWQVHGSKRVYVYPNRPPFLTRQMLEHTAVYADETAVPYDPSYDAEAKVYTLTPRQMIHWPLFSPHRVENVGVSVSYTLQYYTPEIRRRVKVHAANGLIHTRLPNLALKDAIRGPGYVVKAQLHSGLRRLGVMNRMAQGKRATRFRLNPQKLGQIIPI